MRTTLTIDDDVAIQLERQRKKLDASLKDVINDALRRGLQDMAKPPAPREPFKTKAFDMGVPRVSIDNVMEAIAFGEGEDFK